MNSVMNFYLYDNSPLSKSIKKVLTLVCKQVRWIFISSASEIEQQPDGTHFCLSTHEDKQFVFDLLLKRVEVFNLEQRPLLLPFLLQPEKLQNSTKHSLTVNVVANFLHKQKNNPGREPSWLRSLINDILVPMVDLKLITGKDLTGLRSLAGMPDWSKTEILFGVSPSLEEIRMKLLKLK
jgi:hypothetical protein